MSIRSATSPLTEGTEVTLSNYSDMDFTVTLTPSETVYVHE